MRYFVKIFGCCAICCLGVMAGLSFANGNIGVGIFDLFLAATNIPHLVIEFED